MTKKHYLNSCQVINHRKNKNKGRRNEESCLLQFRLAIREIRSLK